ncbi:MAG: DNA cytosine methyltransferase [Spirochaetes bacterium]|nr:DNA cytosine methyltransferase [Spirochaetota bacterium]
MKVIELCAGAGGQALGVEMAGLEHEALIEIDRDACKTLRQNRPNWNIVEADLREVDTSQFSNIDIICGGVPCQPFSIAGLQKGQNDERDLFPEALRFVKELKPKAFFFENVRGFAGKNFDLYRSKLINSFIDLGYYVEWKVIEAADYGVPQLRPRFIMVGKRNGAVPFPWPKSVAKKTFVSDIISDLINENNWQNFENWKLQASTIAPTIVGGSKKHGGPDLGPTRAKKQWAELGIDGSGIANHPPLSNFEGLPKLTNRMVARIQGFPDSWVFAGGKTSVYRQIGNAFPPPVAFNIVQSLLKWINIESSVEPEYEPIQVSLIS